MIIDLAHGGGVLRRPRLVHLISIPLIRRYFELIGVVWLLGQVLIVTTGLLVVLGRVRAFSVAVRGPILLLQLEGRLNVIQSGSEVIALDLTLCVPHSLHSHIVEILCTEVLSGVKG